eukprot:6233531-Pyramimonas_sp.AAC.1
MGPCIIRALSRCARIRRSFSAMLRRRPAACRRRLLGVGLLVGVRPARSCPRSRPLAAALVSMPCCRTCLQMVWVMAMS